jgi:hypothetical protein
VERYKGEKKRVHSSVGYIYIKQVLGFVRIHPFSEQEERTPKSVWQTVAGPPLTERERLNSHRNTSLNKARYESRDLRHTPADGSARCTTCDRGPQIVGHRRQSALEEGNIQRGCSGAFYPPPRVSLLLVEVEICVTFGLLIFHPRTLICSKPGAWRTVRLLVCRNVN